MMKRFVILVGGTGQTVGHYWMQMSFLGLAARDVRILAVDTDQPMASLNFISRTFRPLLVDALTLDVANTVIPRVDFVAVRPELAGNDIMHVLAASPVPARAAFRHEVQAFFTRETLAQPASQGLYARPALSAVVALGDALHAIGEGDIEDDTRVVLVSSCIGGTGGGLAIPLLYRLQSLARKRNNVSVRLVLLGQYFSPRNGTVGDDVLRFASNKTLFLETLRETISGLHSYSFVEQELMPERNNRQEQEARHLPWPEPHRPYWKAVCALQEQLVDTTRATQPNFQAKEVAEGVYRNAIVRDEAGRRLAHALGRVTALQRQQVVLAMGREVFPALQWGRRLTALLRGHYRRTLLACDGDSRVLDGIGSRVQDAIQNLWMPPGDEYGFGTIFPQLEHRLATPSQIRRVGWPVAPTGAGGIGMADANRAASVSAANLLFGAAGFGG